MSLAKTLTKKILEIFEGKDNDVKNQLKLVFKTNYSISLYYGISKKTGKRITLCKSFDSARVTFNTSCLLFSNFYPLLNLLKRHHLGEDDEYHTMVKDLWLQARSLLSYCFNSGTIRNPFNQKTYLKNAKRFGKNYCLLYPARSVTTYMHILIYHMGYYHSLYKDVSLFSNFSKPESWEDEFHNSDIYKITKKGWDPS